MTLSPDRDRRTASWEASTVARTATAGSLRRTTCPLTESNWPCATRPSRRTMERPQTTCPAEAHRTTTMCLCWRGSCFEGDFSAEVTVLRATSGMGRFVLADAASLTLTRGSYSLGKLCRGDVG